jgi:hypothetical protein
MKPVFKGIHAEFLSDDTAEIDLEGARSSGKSWVCCAKVIESCLKYPGIEWLAARYSGEETRNKLKPEFVKMCHRYEVTVEWDGDSQSYVFPEVDGKASRVFMYGLKTQDKAGHFAKIRGLGIACVWVDQTEELDESIALELRATLRQPGYPHQLIFSPNPPNEDSYLSDQFPEDNSLPNRRYYRVSLYDNIENLDAKTISALEQAYPRTHAKNKSLILGMRGPNVTGTPVYDGAFDRTLHLAPLAYDPQSPLLEAFDAGKHHPTWLVAQRTSHGAVHVLGGILGKRLFLEDFLPIVDRYREDWFPGAGEIKTCCDPLPSDQTARYTPATILREAGLRPRSRENGNAPDVRVAMIEQIGALMRRRAGSGQAFLINSTPAQWLMASHALVKQTKLFVDGCEGSYVWDPNYVSVASKTVRQPLFDQWLDGWQRCLENIVLNFCAGQKTAQERIAQRRRVMPRGQKPPGTSMDFMA